MPLTVRERADEKGSLEILVALGKLTPNQREAFYDHTVLHRSQDEIAVTMGVSNKRVSNLVRVGRARFALALGMPMELAA